MKSEVVYSNSRRPPITLAKGDMKPTLRWQKGGNTQLLLRSLLIVGLLNARYPLIPYEMIAFRKRLFLDLSSVTRPWA